MLTVILKNGKEHRFNLSTGYPDEYEFEEKFSEESAMLKRLGKATYDDLKGGQIIEVKEVDLRVNFHEIKSVSMEFSRFVPEERKEEGEESFQEQVAKVKLLVPGSLKPLARSLKISEPIANVLFSLINKALSPEELLYVLRCVEPNHGAVHALLFALQVKEEFGGFPYERLEEFSELLKEQAAAPCEEAHGEGNLMLGKVRKLFSKEEEEKGKQS